MLYGSNIGVGAYCFHELECGFRFAENSLVWDFRVILKLQQQPWNVMQLSPCYRVGQFGVY